MLDAFYGAFSTACFALLGLWLVIVQMRLSEWEKDPERRRRSYGVALHFALPGIMSVFALIDSQVAAFWRVSFAIVAFGGAVVMVAVRGFPAQPGRGRGLPVSDRLGVAAYAVAIILYVLIGVLALVPGRDLLRTEAVLLTALVFLGFNVAWLLMFDDSPPAGTRPVEE
jgi:peptidoglycan/LPS O-acetylase OafA/YrhL